LEAIVVCHRSSNNCNQVHYSRPDALLKTFNEFHRQVQEQHSLAPADVVTHLGVCAVGGFVDFVVVGVGVWLLLFVDSVA
jgi:hypothetical protein